MEGLEEFQQNFTGAVARAVQPTAQAVQQLRAQNPGNNYLQQLRAQEEASASSIQGLAPENQVDLTVMIRDHEAQHSKNDLIELVTLAQESHDQTLKVATPNLTPLVNARVNNGGNSDAAPAEIMSVSINYFLDAQPVARQIRDAWQEAIQKDPAASTLLSRLSKEQKTPYMIEPTRYALLLQSAQEKQRQLAHQIQQILMGDSYRALSFLRRQQEDNKKAMENYEKKLKSFLFAPTSLVSWSQEEGRNSQGILADLNAWKREARQLMTQAGLRFSPGYEVISSEAVQQIKGVLESALETNPVLRDQLETSLLKVSVRKTIDASPEARNAPEDQKRQLYEKQVQKINQEMAEKPLMRAALRPSLMTALLLFALTLDAEATVKAAMIKGGQFSKDEQFALAAALGYEAETLQALGLF